MGSFAVGASGHGQSLIDGGNYQTPQFLFEQVAIAGPRTTFAGNAPTRRVWQAGFVGLGISGTGPSGAIVYGRFITLELEYMFEPPSGLFLNGIDALFWDLDPGVSVYLQVNW